MLIFAKEWIASETGNQWEIIHNRLVALFGSGGVVDFWVDFFGGMYVI